LRRDLDFHSGRRDGCMRDDVFADGRSKRQRRSELRATNPPVRWSSRARRPASPAQRRWCLSQLLGAGHNSDETRAFVIRSLSMALTMESIVLTNPALAGFAGTPARPMARVGQQRLIGRAPRHSNSKLSTICRFELMDRLTPCLMVTNPSPVSSAKVKAEASSNVVCGSFVQRLARFADDWTGEA